MSIASFLSTPPHRCKKNMSAVDAVQRWIVETFPQASNVPADEEMGTHGISVPACSVFVAFGGVLCVALGGFPTAVVRFKDLLHRQLGSELPPEQMGSMWAKVTVAAVRDAASCSEPALWDRVRVALEAWGHRAPPLVAVFHTVALVSFECRSLARRSVRCRVAMEGLGGSAGATSGEIDSASRAKGESVVAEYSLDSSWPSYRDNGVRSRLQPAAAYHAPHGGATLVCFLSNSWAEYLSALQAHLVEHQCGDVFDWMPFDALHMTVRGL